MIKYAVFDKSAYTLDEVKNKSKNEILEMLSNDESTSCGYDEDDYEEFKNNFRECYVINLTTMKMLKL